MQGLCRFLTQPLPMLSTIDGGAHLNGLHYFCERSIYVPFFGVIPILEKVSNGILPSLESGVFINRDLAVILRYMLFVREVQFTYMETDAHGHEVPMQQVMRADPAIRDARSAWFFRAPSLMSCPDATYEGQSACPLWVKGGHLIDKDGVDCWYDSMVKVYHFKGTPSGEFHFTINPGWRCPGKGPSNIQISYFA